MNNSENISDIDSKFYQDIISKLSKSRKLYIENKTREFLLNINLFSLHEAASNIVSSKINEISKIISPFWKQDCSFYFNISGEQTLSFIETPIFQSTKFRTKKSYQLPIQLNYTFKSNNV